MGSKNSKLSPTTTARVMDSSFLPDRKVSPCHVAVEEQGILVFIHKDYKKFFKSSENYVNGVNCQNPNPDYYLRILAWFAIEYVKIDDHVITINYQREQAIRLEFADLEELNEIVASIMDQKRKRFVLLQNDIKEKELGGADAHCKIIWSFLVLNKQIPIYLINTKHVDFKNKAESNAKRFQQKAIADLIQGSNRNLELMLTSLKMHGIKTETCELGEVTRCFTILLREKELKVNKRGHIEKIQDFGSFSQRPRI